MTKKFNFKAFFFITKHLPLRKKSDNGMKNLFFLPNIHCNIDNVKPEYARRTLFLCAIGLPRFYQNGKKIVEF